MSVCVEDPNDFLFDLDSDSDPVPDPSESCSDPRESGSATALPYNIFPSLLKNHICHVSESIFHFFLLKNSAKK